MSLRRRNNGPRKKSTKGFSELNKRTYEASRKGQANRSNYVGQNQQNQYPQQDSGFGHSQPQASRPVRGRGRRGQQTKQFSDYSRAGHVSDRYSKTRKSKKTRKRVKIILIIIASIILLCTAALIAFATMINNNLHEGMDNIGLTPTSLDKPFYMVLMGVDSSNERKANGGTDDNFRSDSIMLVRIDPVGKKVTLMSLHRDTMLDMGEHGTQKLNAAHSLGGPKLVIETVSKFAGVPINHYAEINFDGFKAAVDDLGGVEVDVPMEINDAMAGGHVDQGRQNLNGEQALILCRARHAYDKFGDGDKYRAANQRVVLSSIAKKCLSADIATIAKTVTDLSKYIKTDLALNDIIGLAQIMKDIDIEKDVYSAMEPTEGVYIDGVWYEKVNEEKWKKMMERMDKGLPPEETVIDDATGTVLSKGGDGGSNNSASGSVAVRNGTDKQGVAADAANKLSAKGFKTDAGNANSQDYTETIIVYRNDNQKATAEAIQQALGCGKLVKDNNEYTFETDFLVVIGTDYH